MKRSLAFKIATHDVASVQRKVLSRIIRRNATTAFGREHQFSTAKSVSDFQLRVTPSTYEDYIPAIHTIAQGEKSVLTAEPVMMLEPSSGSTASSKFIPYTQSLREEFQCGLAPWIFDLFTKRPRLLFGSAYWSISPQTPKDWPGSKIPVGFGDDAGYFGDIEQKMIHRILAVSPVVAQIQDVEVYRYVTLLFLLRDRHLAFISVWNPTFLTLLLEPLQQWMTQLIRDIETGDINAPGAMDPELKALLLKQCDPDRQRARDLARVSAPSRSVDDQKTFYEKLWPNLCLISCWTDGHASASLKGLKNLFPNVEIQPKGLIATEGIISFPLLGQKGAVLSIRSHFFEFMEWNGETVNDRGPSDIKLAHQLKEGMRYSVIITTGGGLYRYQLQDIIQVVGFKAQCPVVRFMSKAAKVSDLVGEKLNEFHVATVLNEALQQHLLSPSFYLLAPEKDPHTGIYFYVLFMEIQTSDDLEEKLRFLIKDVDHRLMDNYHYAHCVRLGQLLPAKLFLIQETGKAASIYLDKCRKAGQKIGQVKPAVLSSHIGWSNCFRGEFL